MNSNSGARTLEMMFNTNFLNTRSTRGLRPSYVETIPMSQQTLLQEVQQKQEQQDETYGVEELYNRRTKRKIREPDSQSCSQNEYSEPQKNQTNSQNAKTLNQMSSEPLRPLKHMQKTKDESACQEGISNNIRQPGRQPSDPQLHLLVKKYVSKRNTLTAEEFSELQATHTQLKNLDFNLFKKLLVKADINTRRKRTVKSEDKYQGLLASIGVPVTQTVSSVDSDIKYAMCIKQVVQLGTNILESKKELSQTDVGFFKGILDSLQDRQKQNSLLEEHLKIIKMQLQKELWTDFLAAPDQLILQPYKYQLSKAETLIVFLAESSISTLPNSLLDKALSCIEAQLSTMSFQEIRDVEKQHYAANLFTRLRDKEAFKKLNPKLSDKLLLLMHTQGCIRSTFLPIVIRENLSPLADNQKPKQPFTDALVEYFFTYLNLKRKVAQQIFGDADKFFWEELIDTVSQSEDQVSCMALVNSLHKSSSNPASLVKAIDQATSRFGSMYKYLIDDDQTQGMSLQQVKEVLDYTRDWSWQQIEDSIAINKISGLIDRSVAQFTTANVLVVPQLNELDRVAAEMVSDDEKMQQIYDKVRDISVSWENFSSGLYLHRNIICAIAAKALASNRKAIYLQLNTGNGKTYLNMLICYYLSEIEEKDVVYVTLTRGLKQVVEKKMATVGINGFDVVEEKDLWELIDLDFTFVYDEYHRALTTTRVEFREKNQINPIFKLGHTRPVFMSTAHHSKQFHDFMKKYFPRDQLHIMQHGSITGLAGDDQAYEVTVNVYPEEKYVEEGMAFIKKNCMTRPVIYFGPRFDRDSLQLPRDFFFRWVDKGDDRALEEVQNEAPDHSKGVVGLAYELGVGVDIRFQKDALVIIICSTVPDPEYCRQMVSRGVRSFGRQEGAVFTIGEQGQARHMTKYLMSQRGEDFFDGAQIIKALACLMKSKLSKQAKKESIAKKEGKWIMPQEEMLKDQDEKVQDLLKQNWISRNPF